ncbi:MAG TPA: GMC family oxidoreductase [Vicinamibacteria bacterium]|nr:GMC family oxidoreductase [Vicinamibacteria bacterium]
MQRVYDAIVVGSGITGGWAAKELTEKGLETLVLEAGGPIDPDRDYVEHVQPWQQRFRGLRDRARQSRDQPIQKNCYACDEWSSRFFVNDRENPYTYAEDMPFHWIRGRHVGGRSIMWARQTYRWSDLDFEANTKEGIGVDWPIRYHDIEPWYDYVEEFAGISGQAEGLPHLPDGKFLPPMELNCAERVVKEALVGKFADERTLTIGRCAVLTKEHNGRAPCHYCGPCHRGCITRSYFSSLNATLPAARATGRLTLRPHSVVHSLVYDEGLDRITGVRIIDGQTHEAFEVPARLVFLCASALESTRILLNSKTARFSEGLANSSGTLGRFLMDHVMGGGAEGTIPGHEDRVPYGQRPNGLYVPRFRNVKTKSPFLRGYGFQGGGFRERWEHGLETPGFGADFKHALRSYGPWKLRLYGFGECLPHAENRVSLDPEVVDRWGIPALRVDMRWGENERALLKDMALTAAEILEVAGARTIETFVEDNPPGLTIHEMGTARMGRDPKSSVLNGFNQSHDVPNLFLTDGACMTSSSCVNPSITYMALTARACEYAVKQMDLGHI